MLATINFVWNYFLPSAIFIICYWRILMVVRHRQIRTDNCSLPTSHNQNASTVVTNQHQQLHDSQRDASSSHSRAADGNANAASGATTISHKQLNILQTMILITATFIILWTPSAFTVLFIHFQVCSLHFLQTLKNLGIYNRIKRMKQSKTRIEISYCRPTCRKAIAKNAAKY